jgi:hemerythrin
MSLITWTQEQFGTNVSAHDAEHQAIFASLNELYSAAESGDRSQTGQNLDKLLGIVQAHFAAEEKNLASIGYAGLDAHKAEHDALLSTCTDLHAKFNAGQAEITAETTHFLKDWLTKHIPAVDRAYSEPLNAAGIN